MLARHAAPLVAVAARQLLGGYFLDGLHRVARREAGGGITVERGRGVHIVTGELLGAVHALQVQERGKRHHLAAVILRIKLEHVLGLGAEAGQGLHHHPVHLAKADEVGGVVRAHQSLQGAHGRGHGHALFGG